MIEKLLKSKSSIKWLFIGDSITHGAFHTVGRRDYTEHFRERVRWEMRRMDDFVLNMASSGYKTTDLFAKFDIINDSYHADVVFIMIGINDCVNGISVEEFSKNLNLLADKFAEKHILVIWQTPPLPNGTDYGKNIPPYVEVIRQISKKRKQLLIDHYKYWNENTSRRIYWLSDHIHPNGDGHIAMAQYLLMCLGLFDSTQPTGKFFVP